MSIIKPETDVIAKQFKLRKNDLLEVIFWNKVARPSIFNNLSYRMYIPFLFNNIVNRVFSPDVIQTLENEGLTYDWVSQGSKISVKSSKPSIFERPYKRGKSRKMKKPTAIQLKNTKDTTQLFRGEFDYLMVVMENPVSFGLLDCERVQTLLSQSCNHNKHCNENGYDGKGQVLLYIPKKENCLFYAEIDEQMEKKFAKKYQPANDAGLNMIVKNWHNTLLNKLADEAKVR
jgi:hypothetical protein